jgi:uncharacterized membrane protein
MASLQNIRAETGEVSYHFASVPNFSLSPAASKRVFWGIAALALSISAVFAGLGYWLVLPFAGLEIVGLAWAFKQLSLRGGDYETLDVRGDRVCFTTRVDTRLEQHEFNRAWLRVDLDCTPLTRACRLRLCSHGVGHEIGRFLTDEARRDLADSLRRALRDND